MGRNVWILSGISLAVAVGFGVVSPVLPMFAQWFGVTEFWAAAVIAVFALMRFVFSPAVGPLDGRFGHRAVLLAGLVLVALSSLAAGLAGSYWQLLVLRGLGGIGSAMFSVSGMSVLLASVDAGHRGRAAGLYQGGFLVGAMLGPAVGGSIGAISFRAPFFFYAGTLAVAAIVALWLRPVGVAVKTKAGTARSFVPMALVARDRRFQAAALANLVHGWNSHGARAALVPLFVAANLAASPSQAARLTGLVMALGAAAQMACVWPAGYVTDRFGRRWPMVFGALISAAALAAIPFCSTWQVLAAVLAAYGVGAALLGTAPAALVGDVTSQLAQPRHTADAATLAADVPNDAATTDTSAIAVPNATISDTPAKTSAATPAQDSSGGNAKAVAVFSMCGDAGSIIGPLVAGALTTVVSFHVAFGLGAVLWLASAAASTRLK